MHNPLGLPAFSMSLYQTYKIIMSKNQTRRGGKRAGAGRPRNLQKACQILAIAHQNVVSEATARRYLSESGGSLKYLLKPSIAKMLGEEFYDVPEDENVETYEYLRGLVDRNREQGWTRKL
jgi:hypothetical protein